VIYPYFERNEGQFSMISGFSSKILKNKRDIIVYLPPSYYENTKKVISNLYKYI